MRRASPPCHLYALEGHLLIEDIAQCSWSAFCSRVLGRVPLDSRNVLQYLIGQTGGSSWSGRTHENCYAVG